MWQTAIVNKYCICILGWLISYIYLSILERNVLYSPDLVALSHYTFCIHGIYKVEQDIVVGENGKECFIQ